MRYWRARGQPVFAWRLEGRFRVASGQPPPSAALAGPLSGTAGRRCADSQGDGRSSTRALEAGYGVALVGFPQL
jgi:hypothetical protein